MEYYIHFVSIYLINEMYLFLKRHKSVKFTNGERDNLNRPKTIRYAKNDSKIDIEKQKL